MRSTALALALALAGCATVRPPNAEPVVRSEVRISYPEESLKEGRSGTVVLRVGIDPWGRVSDVRVIASPGAGLGAAAREAVGRFTFEPALVNGRPISSRIVYRYTYCFEGAPCDPPPPGPDLLTHGDVVAAVGPRLAALDACIASHRAAPGDVAGVMTLRWTVRADGSVANVELEEGAALAPRLADCLAAEAATWRFRAHEAPDDEWFTLPVVF